MGWVHTSEVGIDSLSLDNTNIYLHKVDIYTIAIVSWAFTSIQVSILTSDDDVNSVFIKCAELFPSLKPSMNVIPRTKL